MLPRIPRLHERREHIDRGRPLLRRGRVHPRGVSMLLLVVMMMVLLGAESQVMLRSWVLVVWRYRTTGRGVGHRAVVRSRGVLEGPPWEVWLRGRCHGEVRRVWRAAVGRGHGLGVVAVGGWIGPGGRAHVPASALQMIEREAVYDARFVGRPAVVFCLSGDHGEREVPCGDGDGYGWVGDSHGLGVEGIHLRDRFYVSYGQLMGWLRLTSDAGTMVLCLPLPPGSTFGFVFGAATTFAGTGSSSSSISSSSSPSSGLALGQLVKSLGLRESFSPSNCGEKMG